MSQSKTKWHATTLSIHGPAPSFNPHGALVAPLYQTSTFVFPSTGEGGARFAGEQDGFIYTRLGNPTVQELEQRVAALEGMPAAAASATGMGAIAAAMLAFLKAGDHVIASDCLYGCSFALLNELFARFAIEVSFVDLTAPEQLAAAYRSNTRMVFLETPANPHLRIIDLAPIGEFCRQHELKFIVDNTFLTPLLQCPGEFGADLVVHSATKYLNGHGDVVAGLITGSEEDIHLIKMTTLKDMGATISPHDAWLITRGLKTLSLRMERHESNAQAVAAYLNQHPALAHLYYPGLVDHPGYELIGPDKQMKGAGAVLAFDMKGGYQAAVTLLDNLQLIQLAVSLGDAETLIQHPASMTHSPLTAEARAVANIGEGLVRLSVGLEHIDDILADLEQGFAQVANAGL